MKTVLGLGVVLISVVLGFAAGTFAVRYVFPAPPLLPGGLREGTPVQLIAFAGAFGLVFVVSLVLGFSLLERRRRG